MAGATALSLGAHASLAVALLLAWRSAPTPPALRPIAVTFVRPIEPVTAAPAQASAPAKAPAPRNIVRPTPAPAAADPLPAAPAPASAAMGDGLTDAELAGAATPGSGPPGGACDMARRLQSALRKDPLVQAAVRSAGSEGRAILVWNGDWVQSRAEDGKGLAAVREAITWEVAFAPAACRAEPMRGLVLLSLNEDPGGARLALGSGAWRWSDLLGRGTAR
jgi:hypothetical protein